MAPKAHLEQTGKELSNQAPNVQDNVQGQMIELGDEKLCWLLNHHLSAVFLVLLQQHELVVGKNDAEHAEALTHKERNWCALQQRRAAATQALTSSARRDLKRLRCRRALYWRAGEGGMPTGAPGRRGRNCFSVEHC